MKSAPTPSSSRNCNSMVRPPTRRRDGIRNQRGKRKGTRKRRLLAQTSGKDQTNCANRPPAETISSMFSARTAAVRRSRSARRNGSSSLQLFRDKFVEQRGIRLAFGSAHHLSDEKPRERLFAGAVLLHLFGVGRDSFVNQHFNRRGVGNLLRLFALVDGLKVLAFLEAGVEELLHLFRADFSLVQ